MCIVYACLLILTLKFDLHVAALVVFCGELFLGCQGLATKPLGGDQHVEAVTGSRLSYVFTLLLF
jgi:hypothetical protein